LFPGPVIDRAFFMCAIRGALRAPSALTRFLRQSRIALKVGRENCFAFMRLSDVRGSMRSFREAPPRADDPGHEI
jgi:hypothetical protein